MKVIRIILALSFFLIVCMVFAEDSKPPVSLTVDQIIEKIKNAADPNGGLVKAETKVTEGEVDMPAQKIRAEVKTFFKKPCKFMVETYFPNGTVEKGGYDGKTAWKKPFSSEKSVEIKGKDRSSFILGSYLESPDISVWREVFSSINLDNELQRIDGALCYKLTCVPNASFEIDSPVIFFIDVRNFLIKRMDISSYSNGKEFRQNVLVNEYKDFNGVMVPSKTRTDVFGAVIDYNITKFELNRKLADKLFMKQD